MGGEDLHVPVPTLRSLSSTQSVHKAAKASGGFPETEWLSPHNISRQHVNATSGQGQLQQMIQLTYELFKSFGLMMNQKKSVLMSTQELGFYLCSATMRLSIPSEKLRKIQQGTNHMLDQESVSVREITKFVGKTTAMMRTIPLAPLHYRALQLLMNSVLPLNYNHEEIFTKYEILVTLTPASKPDLEWWIGLKKAPSEHQCTSQTQQ